MSWQDLRDKAFAEYVRTNMVKAEEMWRADHAFRHGAESMRKVMMGGRKFYLTLTKDGQSILGISVLIDSIKPGETILLREALAKFEGSGT